MRRLIIVLCAVLAIASQGGAQTVGTLIPAPRFAAYDNNGDPLVGGLVYTYAAGTTTPLATYSDVGLTTPNANPVVLDAGGRATIYLQPASYKIVLKTSAAATVWTQDNVSATSPFNVDLDVTGVAGESVSARDCVVMADAAGTGGTTAGRWHKCDADSTHLSTTTAMVGFVVAAFTTGDSGSIRISGRMTGFTGLTPGAPYYVSSTAGSITATAPTLRRFVGAADTASTLVINPQSPATLSGGTLGPFYFGTTPGTGIAGGATAYLGDRGRSGTETSAQSVSPFTGTMTGLYIKFDGPPGAGETFTVTVRKNVGDTALTCTVSGAVDQSCSDVTHAVTVTANDFIAVKVVASATASTREAAGAFSIGK